MAGASSKSNPPRPRKRVEAETSSLKRAKDGSAFTKCEECNKDVAVVLIDMHSCSLDSKIRMNLEAQVVEKSAEVKKPAERKRAASSVSNERKGKKVKKSSVPNKPKRPPSAFFLFMDDFRKSYKEAHPGSKGGALVAKEGGVQWKSMTEEEKKPYVDRGVELKAEYDKAVGKFNAEEEEKEASDEDEKDVKSEKDDEDDKDDEKDDKNEKDVEDEKDDEKDADDEKDDKNEKDVEDEKDDEKDAKNEKGDEDVKDDKNEKDDEDVEDVKDEEEE